LHKKLKAYAGKKEESINSLVIKAVEIMVAKQKGKK